MCDISWNDNPLGLLKISMRRRIEHVTARVSARSGYIPYRQGVASMCSRWCDRRISASWDFFRFGLWTITTMALLLNLRSSGAILHPKSVALLVQFACASALILSLPTFLKTFLNVSVRRNNSYNNHLSGNLSKLWKANFFIMCGI